MCSSYELTGRIASDVIPMALCASDCSQGARDFSNLSVDTTFENKIKMPDFFFLLHHNICYYFVLMES